jgi:hypothetical protein
MLPLLGIGQGLLGIGQSIFGGGAARKAQRSLEKMADSYQPNAGILDYYNKALSRYSDNPYNSAMYRMQNQNAQRGLATGINALQDRRSVLAGLPKLTQSYNDANLKAAAGAEAQQGQALSQLGQATGMKAAEDSKKFDMKYNLLAMKAAGNNQTSRAGISNIFGGLGNIQQQGMLNQIYGNGGGGSTNNPNSQYPKGTNPDGSPHW